MTRPRFVTLLAAGALSSSAVQVGNAAGIAPLKTATPIENLIVIMGENQTFDGLFATYVPRTGATVRNLLSEGIITADGNARPRFDLARQQRAVPQAHYILDPPRAGPYPVLPPPRLIGVQDQKFQLVGTGDDPRFPANLPTGPFQITRYVPYPPTILRPTLGMPTRRCPPRPATRCTGSSRCGSRPVATTRKPDLFTWVAVTTGMGADTIGVTAADPGQGGELMGFVNMQRGDAAICAGSPTATP